MLLLDVYFAFSGALVYFLFFDVLIGYVGMPRWTAVSQLAANFLYGVYGLSVFLSRTTNSAWFRSLIFSNIGYAILCAVVGLSLISENKLASAVLISEALLILVLAKFEFRSLPSGPTY
jgi:hypothetical protein